MSYALSFFHFALKMNVVGHDGLAGEKDPSIEFAIRSRTNGGDDFILLSSARCISYCQICNAHASYFSDFISVYNCSQIWR